MAYGLKASSCHPLKVPLPPYIGFYINSFPIALYSMIITKLVGLFTSLIDIEKCVHSWAQYKCHRRSAVSYAWWRVGICVGIPCSWIKKSLTIPADLVMIEV